MMQKINISVAVYWLTYIKKFTTKQNWREWYMVKYVKIEEQIDIPKGLSVTIDDSKQITIEGEKGKVVKDFSHAKSLDITVNKEDGKMTINAPFPKKREISMAKTVKNLILNCFSGVQEQYIYKMKIVYSHFPITVEAPKRGDDKVLIKNFIGERAPRVTNAVGDVSIKTDKEEVVVTGCDKESVGQTCANIQLKCRIRDKDKRVFQDGIYVFAKYLGDKLLWKIK